MNLAIPFSIDMTERSFCISCFVINRKYDLISFSLLKLYLQDADIMGQIRNI
jgi:hypothetical protein